MRNFVNIAIALGILLAGGGIAFYYGYHIPKIESEKILAQQNKDKEEMRLKDSKFRLREECLASVDSWFSSIDPKSMQNEQNFKFLITERDKRNEGCYRKYSL